MTTAANEFMMNLHKNLLDRGLTESTVKTYIRTLITVNDKKPFKSFAFLKKRADILKKIEGYAEKTQRAIIATICSVLATHKEKGYKKCYSEWSEMLKDKKTEPPTGEKTEKEAEAWLSWKDVETKRDELKKAVDEFKDSKKLTEAQFDTLQKYVLVSLYTMIPPRRNLDYLTMTVVSKELPTLATDTNYLVLESGTPTKFIFNKYKSVKKHGQQSEAIPADLAAVLKTYIAHHPNKTKAVKKFTSFPFLVTAAGVPITTINFITRALNKVFGRKVGSSMLRHIYLSSKYDLEEMKKDAEAMGHTVGEQRNYLRIVKDDEDVSDED